MQQFYTLFFINRSTAFLKNAMLIVFFLICHFSANAQVSAYSFAQSNGTYTPITGTILGSATGNTSATNLNSEVYSITLPFGFKFNNTSYTSLNVSSNGFITFGTTPPLTSTTAPLSATVAYNGAVSAFGRDINSIFDVASVTGNISWDVVGTAPNREVVIQWKDFRPTNTTSTTAAYTFSFQIRLQETSDVIRAIYSSGSYLAGSTAYTSTVQVGLRGSTNLDFNNRLNASTTEFINSTAGTANSSVQNFSTTNAIPGMPTSGLTYIWTPPLCFAPVLTTASSTPNSITVNWTASSSSPATYDVYYNTTNIAPTGSTTPSQTNITGLTTTIGSLPPTTIFYVWVRSSCGSGSYTGWSTEPIVINTTCQPPSLISTTGAIVCPGAAAVLNATTSTGSQIRWYDSATGGTSIASGNSYTTPALTTTTNYWATAVKETQGNVGKQTIETGATTGGGLSSYMIFSVSSTFKLQTVDLYPYSAVDGTPGTATIELRNSSGTVLQSKVVNVIGHNSTANSTAQTVLLDFVIPPGSNYRLGVGAWTGITNMYRDSNNLAFPYSFAGVVDITGGSFATPYFYFFYNWGIVAECESARQQVTATVDAVGCLATSEIDKKDVVKVYPNPFSEVVNITKPELVRAIMVSDVSGKLLRTINQPESVLRLNDLSAGMYILKFDMKDGSTQTIKIIKK